MTVKIDGIEHKISDNSLTVSKILELGGKPKESLNVYELIRIENGNEDILFSKIKKPGASLKDEIHISENELFSIRIATYTIYVNAAEKEWPYEEIRYKEVVELALGAFMDNPNIAYTVLYFEGLNGAEGSLVRNTKVKVANEMNFTVSQTDKS